MQKIFLSLLLFLLLPQGLLAQERKSPSEIFQEAVTRFEAGRYHEAEMRLSWVIHLSSYRARAQYYLGRIAKKRGDCTTALAKFDLAVSYDRREQIPEEELLEERTECQVLLTEIPLSPGLSANTEARVALEEGEAAFLRRDYPTALALLKEALLTRPQDARVHYYLGLTKGALGEEEEAIRSLTVARRLDPRLSFASPDAYYYEQLAKLQVHAGSRDKGPPRFFDDPLLDGALSALPKGLSAKGFFIADLSGAGEEGQPEEALTASLEKLAREYQKLPVLLFLEEHPHLDPKALADLLWEVDLGHREGAILILGTPSGLAIRALDLSAQEEEQIATEALLGAGPGRERFTVATAGLLRLYKGKFTMRLAALVAGGSVMALLVGLFGISRRKRRLSLQESYRRVYERFLALLPDIAEQLGRARLSLCLVPDDEAEDLLEAGERLFFHARAITPKLSAPKARRLPQALAEEGLLALEEAGRRVRRAKTLLGEDELAPQGRPLGCFFCARPVGDTAGSYRTRVLYQEASQEVMVCRPCARAIDRKKTPDVKMVLRRGRRRHWSQTRAFVPCYDFYQPRLPEEALLAQEAWSELFGDDEADGVFPEERTRTFTTLPVLAALTVEDAATPPLALDFSEPEPARDAPPRERGVRAEK